MTSEPKRGKPNNIHRQQSLENCRKIIAVQELLLTNFVITFKNACNYARLIFTLEGVGTKQEKEIKYDGDNGGRYSGGFEDNDGDDDDYGCGADGFAGGDVSDDAMLIVMLIMMMVKVNIL